MEQQKQKKNRCQIEQLKIPVLYKLVLSQYKFGNQLLVYINNSKVPMIQFENALTDTQIVFQKFEEGLIAEQFKPNITLLYLQNIYFDDQNGHGWFIRAVDFLFEIWNKEKTRELQFVFHFSSIFNQNEQTIEQFVQIYSSLVKKVYEVNSTPYMTMIEGDNYQKLIIKEQNINLQKIFEESFSQDTLEMELNDILPYLVLHPTFQERNNANLELDYVIFSYIEEQITLIFDEFFEEIMIFKKLILFLLQVNVNAQDKNKEVQKFRTLVKEILLDYPREFDFEHHLNETFTKIDQFFLKTVPLKFNEIKKCLKKLMEQNQLLQDELKESKYMKQGYEFNFKFADYDKVLVHYSIYLPIDKIQLKVQQNNQTVEILLKNYEKQIELKLYNLSQLINLKFAYQETSKKSIFVLGLSKVGKSTLLNILKQPQCLEIKVENYLPNFSKKVEQSQLIQQISSDNEPYNDIKISSVCVSETDSLNYITIDQRLFVDTPGFDDTNEKVRLRNTLNIYQGIHKMNKVAFFLVFDGFEMQKNKLSFQNTLNHFNTLVGKQFLEENPTLFILPIFTKVYPLTMDQIKSTWNNYEKNTEGLLNKMIKIIKQCLDENNFVEIYDANYLQQENISLTPYLEEVQLNILAKCDIVFKEQFKYDVQKPELKLTLKSELQDQFQIAIEYGQFFLDLLVEYLKEEILIQLFEILRDQNELCQFLELAQQEINKLKEKSDFIGQCEQFQELFYKIKVQLNFEYSHYYQNLSNQFIKLIEIYKVTQQNDLLQKFKKYDFSKLIDMLNALDISFKKAIESINQDKNRKLNFLKNLKRLKNCSYGFQAIELIGSIAVPELAAAAFVASSLFSVAFNVIIRKIKQKEATIEQKFNNQQFQIIFKQFYEEQKKQIK